MSLDLSTFDFDALIAKLNKRKDGVYTSGSLFGTVCGMKLEDHYHEIKEILEGLGLKFDIFIATQGQLVAEFGKPSATMPGIEAAVEFLTKSDKIITITREH